MSIEVQNITKQYGSQKALDTISFSVSKGEIVGFLGPNGAGKSTALNIITGLLPPTSGEVLINGDSLLKNRRELFDLEKDLSETTDLAAKHPKVVSVLTDKYNAWLDEMAEPVSKQEKRWNPAAGALAKKMSKEEKKAAREKKKAARIKAREAK